MSHLVDQAFPLKVAKAGRMIVLGRSLPNIDAVPGTRIVLIGEGAREALIEYLERASIDEAAEAMRISRGLVSHLKRGLQIGKSYTGDSATTQWRRRKAQEGDGND